MHAVYSLPIAFGQLKCLLTGSCGEHLPLRLHVIIFIFYKRIKKRDGIFVRTHQFKDSFGAGSCLIRLSSIFFISQECLIWL